MTVDKIILRAFLTTLASVAILFLFMITALVCVYPQTMMRLTYDLGMEKASVWFAEVSYDRSDDVYYIAYATEVAIDQQNYEKIESCGAQFIADEDFDDFCADKNAAQSTETDMTYTQYVYGQICVAKYALGHAGEAVDLAFELTGKNAFPKNNAVVAVLFSALREDDAETVALIREKMNKQSQVGTEDKAYFDAILALTESK